MKPWYALTIKKLYDMVPQNWIIKSQKMFKISNKNINFIMKAMENWKVELAAGCQILTEVKIQKSIFKGDSLSPLQ